jgi:hypothetical protein
LVNQNICLIIITTVTWSEESESENDS